MIFDYFDLLSGENLYFSNVGHIRQPKLKELTGAGIGYDKYKLFISILSYDAESMKNMCASLHIKGFSKIENLDLSSFDITIILPQILTLTFEALSFFIFEPLSWDDKKMVFNILKSEDDKTIVGTINRDNFEEVKKAILQINYIGLFDDKPVRHSTAASEDLWNKAQSYLKQYSDTKPKLDYSLSNIISKLSVVHKTYNLLNIYDLTIFQLYDQFFQCEYLRGYDIGERIFTIHGGNDFKFENWLKPILK